MGMNSDIARGAGWRVLIMRSSVETPCMSGSQASTTKEKSGNMNILLTCYCAQPRRV